MSELAIWMNGERVGVWSAPRRGLHTLTYDEAWTTSDRARALSLSLPFTTDLTVRGAAVANYFDNLLPDSAAIRERMRRKHDARSTGAFDLLLEIGRDCVGAVQLLPPGAEPGEVRQIIKGDPLSDSQVAGILRGITSAGPAFGATDDDDFRISIAGAQEKTALLKVGDHWHVPRGATPTTHILKLPLGLVGNMRMDMQHSVENEWLCLRLLRLLGLPTAMATMEQFGSQKVLVVERFDRQRMSGSAEWIARLPQEDFCQASGLPPSMKYEKDGGPGIESCMKLLSGSVDRHLDMETFALGQLAFWLLAATDGHAKNFSIFNLRAGQYAMTPLYDVLSAWPVVGHGANLIPLQKVRMAMAVKSKTRHDLMETIRPRHWEGVAQQSNVPGLLRTMVTMVERVDAVLETAEEMLPSGFPMTVFNAISKGVQRQARKFLDAATAGRDD